MKFMRLFSFGLVLSTDNIQLLQPEKEPLPVIQKRQEENKFEDLLVDIQNYKVETMLKSEEILRWQKKGYAYRLKELPERFQHTINVGDEEGKGSLFMGWIYHIGIGVEQNFEMAIKFYNASIEKNNSTAMNNLACIYLQGEGVEQNFEIASKLYEKAIEAKNIMAMRNLSDWYFCGIGIEQNCEKGIELLELAGECGDVESLYLLGYRYEHGRGVKQSYKKTKKYYKKAIEKGDSNSMNNLGFLYQYGEKFISQNYGKAVELYTKAIEKGDPDAMYNLAGLYCDAVGLYRKAFMGESKGDLEELSILISSKENIKENYIKAIELYEKAVNIGHVPSMYNLAQMYYFGEGVKRDGKRAVELYTQAAEHGDEESLYKLGYMFTHGEIVSMDLGMSERILMLINWDGKKRISNLSKQEMFFLGMCLKLFKVQDISDFDNSLKKIKKSQIKFESIEKSLKNTLKIKENLENDLIPIFSACVLTMERAQNKTSIHNLSEIMILTTEMPEILLENERCFFPISKEIFRIFNQNAYEIPFKFQGIQVYKVGEKYYASIGYEAIEFSKKLIHFLNGKWVTQNEIKRKEIREIQNALSKVTINWKKLLNALGERKIQKLQSDDNLDQDVINYLTNF